jgi:CheY-like chemotaxis protein
MEAIGTLAGGVAHNLNNVLSGIVNYSDLLLMELPEESPLRKPILTIQQSGQKAAAIVQDLLTLARRGIASTEITNINQVVNDYLDSPDHEKLIEFHADIKIESRIETDLLNIMGSPVHLSKTIMNLDSNAAEAMPDGGQGSTFTLYFPATRKEIIGKEKVMPIAGYKGKGESILVVDDVEEQREIASQMLNKLDYSVISVSSGEEAVEYMKNNSVDLLVLDMIMDPGIDGLDSYKRILKLRPHQKAIIASGFSETERVKEVQRLGAGKYIKKPYTLEKIGLAVKEELEK